MSPQDNSGLNWSLVLGSVLRPMSQWGWGLGAEGSGGLHFGVWLVSAWPFLHSGDSIPGS